MPAFRRAALVLVAALGATLALVPAAVAGPLGAWASPPTAISAPDTHIPWNPMLASGGSGTPTTAALWMFDRSMEVAIRRGAGAFGDPILITDNINAGSPAIAVAPDGATWVAHAGTGVSDQGVGVVRVGTDGAVGAERVLATGPAYGEAVAIGTDGTVVVAWHEAIAEAYAIRVAVRSAAGTWGDATTLSRGGQNYSPQIAIAPSGEITIAWGNGIDFSGSTRIQIATRPVGGAFSAPQALGADGGWVDGIRLATAADGTAVLAWEGSGGGRSVRTAVRAPGGSFGAVTKLPQPTGKALSMAPALAVRPNGGAAIAWLATDDAYAGGAIFVATRTAGGAFGAPIGVSGTPASTGTTTPSIAIAGGGALVVGWTDVAGSINRVRTATQQPGESFAAPATLDTATDTRAGDERAPVAAPQLAAVPGGRMTAAFFSATSSNATFETTTTRDVLEVDTVNGALGTVRSDVGGIACGATCWGSFDAGDTVTLTATGVGGLFEGWDGACTGTARTCTVTIAGSTSVTARFAVAPEAQFRAAPGGQAAAAPVAAPSAPVVVATTLVAPGPGTFVQSGSVVDSTRGLRAAPACRTRLAVRTAGSYALSCQIGAATRAILRRHALRLAITTRFTAPNGKWSQFTRVITIPRLPKAPPRPEPVTG